MQKYLKKPIPKKLHNCFSRFILFSQFLSIESKLADITTLVRQIAYVQTDIEDEFYFHLKCSKYNYNSLYNRFTIRGFPFFNQSHYLLLKTLKNCVI